MPCGKMPCNTMLKFGRNLSRRQCTMKKDLMNIVWQPSSKIQGSRDGNGEFGDGICICMLQNCRTATRTCGIMVITTAFQAVYPCSIHGTFISSARSFLSLNMLRRLLWACRHLRVVLACLRSPMLVEAKDVVEVDVIVSELTAPM